MPGRERIYEKTIHTQQKGALCHSGGYFNRYGYFGSGSCQCGALICYWALRSLHLADAHLGVWG